MAYKLAAATPTAAVMTIQATKIKIWMHPSQVIRSRKWVKSCFPQLSHHATIRPKEIKKHLIKNHIIPCEFLISVFVILITT